MTGNAPNTRTCSRCQKTLPQTSEFFAVRRTHSSGFQHVCKPCGAQASRERYARKLAEDPEGFKAELAATMKASYERRREKILAQKKEKYRQPEERERIRVANKEWNEKNREHRRAYARTYAPVYYARNQGKILQYMKDWRQKNHEHRLAVEADWRRRNPGKNVEYSRARRLRNPDKVREMERAYRQNNPEKGRRTTSIRRARKAGNGGSYSLEDTTWLWYEQGGLCFYCKCILEDLPISDRHIDHMQPVSRGGTSDPSNLCWACRSCNLRKHNKTSAEFRSWVARQD